MDSNIAYENFDLFIGYGPSGHFRAKVQRSLAGNASADFVLPFSEEEIAGFLWQQLGSSRNYGDSDGEGQQLDVGAFGRSLYGAVFAGDVGLKLRDNLILAAERSIGLRIRVQIDPDLPVLADLPWEYLCSSEGHYLARSSKTPLVRYLEVGCGEALAPVRPPLHVLAVLSNPRDVTQLEVDKEWQRLREVTSPLEERGLLRLKRLANPTPARLRTALRSPVHVLHFVGHGFFDDSQNLGGLIFENESGGSQVVTAKELAELLQDCRTLRLVFLNACEGAVSGRSNSFAGVAQGLVQRCVPVVLAMQFPISDPAAIALSREFYSALADGYPIDAALSDARKAIQEAGGPLEWGTPVLFSRSDDNRLIQMPEGDARPVIERQSWEPETILIEGGPFLMGSQPGEGIPAHETPQCEVDLPDYRIGRYPVTNHEFAEFVRRTKRLAAPEWGWQGQKPREDQRSQPVTGVTWFDALEYCQWLSQETERDYTLPSEAQWEKAARGPSGCEGMTGSVRQWTRSLWGERRKDPDPLFAHPGDAAARNELTAASVVRRIYRGASASDDIEDQRCTTRRAAAPDSPGLPGQRFGLRVVVELGKSVRYPNDRSNA